jgi:2,4-dienoyl-CoA reductase-like NADH-dependent reductase (Old Yellow Enzyme family)
LLGAFRNAAVLRAFNLPALLGTCFPARRWRASNKLAEAKRLKDILSSYTDEEINHHLESFLRSAFLAKEAGYDVVQVHAAHGYLLSLLLHPQTNTRLGRYSLHAPWFEEFLGQMSDALGESLLSIRLSTLTGLAPENEEIEWTRSIEDRAAKSGVDIVDLSAGFYTIDRRLIYPGRRCIMPVYSRWLKTLTHDLPCLVAIAGRFTDFRTFTEELPVNILVAVGRALIADPDFAAKSRDGQFDEINFCQLKNRCHYFSRGRNALECGVNPTLSKE